MYQLTLLEFLQGLFSSIFVIITLLLAFTILLKYIKYKTRDYILVGLTWIGLANGWIPDLINFLLILLNYDYLTEVPYFIIGFAFMPLFVICWLTALTDLAYKEKQKLILIIFIIYCGIHEITFFILLFIGQFGTLIGPFQVEFGLIIQILLTTMMIIVIVTGILFSRELLRSEERELKLKGKLVLIAFILFTIGAFLEVVVPLIAITVVITRLVLIASAIIFYIGFILPDWAKKALLK